MSGRASCAFRRDDRLQRPVPLPGPGVPENDRGWFPLSDVQDLLLPLTAAQSGIWFAQELDPANVIYNAA